MRTYAILDAAKVTNLPEMLEDSELEYRCLFKGKAYDDLKNAAPWLVRLEDGKTLTRNLLTRSDAHWHLWDDEPGIYIRSRGTLDELWRHLRRFTRLQDEAGQWLYFRFWDPKTIRTFLEKADWSKRPPLLDPNQIQSLVVIGADGKGAVIEHGLQVRDNGGSTLLNISREIIYDNKVIELRSYFRELTPKRFRAIGPEGQDEFLRHLMRRAAKLGVTAYSEIAYLGCLMQNFGCWLDIDPTYHRMNRYLSAPELKNNPHRIDLLHQERAIFVKSCVGERGETELRCRREIMADFAALNGQYSQMDRGTIVAMMRSKTPERFEYSGIQAISDLLRESERLASSFALEKEWHLAAFASLAYALGIGFFDDPFYPWARQFLVDTESSADKRMTRLMQYAEKRLRKSIMEAGDHVQ